MKEETSTKRRRKLQLALLVIVVSVIVVVPMVSIHGKSKKGEKGIITFDGLTRTYGGCNYAAIIRVDDLIVDNNFSKELPNTLIGKNKYFNNYENALIDWMLKNKPNVPLTIGVITGCPSGNCSYYWNIYSVLARRGWEIASHSRWHVRPPRKPEDYLGSIKDIESNITNYSVVTYIAPFGKFSMSEILNLKKKTCVRVLMTTWPFQIRIPRFRRNDIVKIGFTVKLSQHLPWKPYLWIAIHMAKTIRGLLIVYTHATSYDWRNPSSLIHALAYTIGRLEQSNAWVTTPRELFSYELEVNSIEVIRINTTSFKILYSLKLPCNLNIVPVTLKFKVAKGYLVKTVLIDGKILPRYFNKTCKISEGPWYLVSEREVYVTLLPRNGEIITIISEGSKK